MPTELLTPLPPGADSFTRLARQDARYVVLREIKEGTDCSYPLGSPNLVTLQEVIELEGKRQALFPYVPGVTLREVLDVLDDVPVGFVARVVIDAARALQNMQPPRAHGGIADSSLQLGFDGVVSVLDFGAPRVSRFRSVGRVNFSADVFALGAVIHSALTGFEGEYATRLATLPAPSTSHDGVSAAVDDVVMKAIAAEPDARQSGAGVFADELTAALGDALFTTAQVAELVQQHFGDRQRLLAELTSDEVALGDASVERTEPRIVAPPPSEKELVPWDSKPSLPPVMVVDESGPALGTVDERTQPRVNLPAGPVPVVETSAPRATGDKHSTGPSPRMTGQRAALAPRRSTGEFVLASSEVEAPITAEPSAKTSGPVPGAVPSAPRRSSAEVPPRATGQREALDPNAETGINPRPSALIRKTGARDAITEPRPPPRKTGAREAVVADKTSEDVPKPVIRKTGARDAVAAPVRKTGQRDALGEADTNPRASAPAPVRKTGQRDALGDADTSPRASAPVRKPLGEVADDATNPRASAPVRATGQRAPTFEEADPTNPRAQNPLTRSANTADRLWAVTQERVETPPHGTPVALDEVRDEPTAVRERPRGIEPEVSMTGEGLVPVSEPALEQPKSQPFPLAMGLLILFLLLAIVGIGVGVLWKVQAANEPEPLPEQLEVDAGVVEVDAGEEALEVLPVLPTVVEDAGVAEEEVDDADAGEEDDDELDAGVVDAGASSPAPVLKKAVNKKRRRRR